MGTQFAWSTTAGRLKMIAGSGTVHIADGNHNLIRRYDPDERIVATVDLENIGWTAPTAWMSGENGCTSPTASITASSA